MRRRSSADIKVPPEESLRELDAMPSPFIGGLRSQGAFPVLSCKQVFS